MTCLASPSSWLATCPFGRQGRRASPGAEVEQGAWRRDDPARAQPLPRSREGRSARSRTSRGSFARSSGRTPSCSGATLPSFPTAARRWGCCAVGSTRARWRPPSAAPAPASCTPTASIRATRAASRDPRAWRLSGWSRRRTQAAAVAGRARSPSQGRCTPAGCWSRPPGTTAAHPAAARRWPPARTASRRTSSRSPERPSSVCTAPGNDWSASAASARRWSPSRSPASWPGSAGR
jgi:hypothetical protein